MLIIAHSIASRLWEDWSVGTEKSISRVDTLSQNVLESLLHSEQKYRSLFERNPDGVFAIDPAGRFTLANPACSAITGYSEAELLCKRFTDLCAPDCLAATMAKFQHIIAGEPPENLNTAIIHKAGHRVELLITGGPVVIDGKVTAVHCAAKDITKAKQAEEALQRREEEFRSLVDNSPDVVERFDRDFRLLYVNAAHTRATGIPAPAVIGKAKNEMGLSQELLVLWEAHLDAAFRQRREVAFEFDYPSPKGLLHFDARLIPEFDQGNVRTVLSILRDTTVRHRIVAFQVGQNRVLELLATGESLQGVLSAVVQMVEAQCWQVAASVLLLDPDGKHLRHGASPSLPSEYSSSVNALEIGAQSSCCGAAACLGQTVIVDDIACSGFQLVYRQLAQRLGLKACWAQPIFATDRHVIGVLVLYPAQRRGPDADELRLIESAAHLAGIAIERYCAAAAIKQAKEAAEHANHAKDHFLAVLSHELRTPLTPILTAAQMLENSDIQDPEVRRSLSMIRRNAALEARLIDDLLDITRISRGKLEVHCSPLDLHQKIEHVLEMCRKDLEAKPLQLSVQLHAAQHCVDGDAARLQQVLWNLLKNAIKFTPPGGRISILTSNPQPGRIAVDVQDSGMGILPDALPRIFDAFEQASKEVTRQFGGMGLGLAISRNLAALHGGSLTAQSEGKDRGATFILELPLTSASPAGISRDSHRRDLPDLKHSRVLLVEDHPDTAKIMTLLLRSYGFHVRAAASAAAALKLVEEAGPFDLLISDIGLPDGNGVDLFRRIRQCQQIIGIALSGYGMEEDIRRSREAGFAAHLTKPVDVKLLEKTLHDLMRGLA